MIRSVLLLLAVLSSSIVVAQEELWQLVGQARLKVLFWPVYDSRLYSLDGAYHDGQRPLRLEIRYLRDIAAAELVENTQNEWQRLPPVPAQSEQWLQQLAQMWPDVSAGDVLDLQVGAHGRSAFRVNGQLLGVVDDPDFGQYFLSIWLSPQTSRPDLRLALIGEE